MTTAMMKAGWARAEVGVVRGQSRCGGFRYTVLHRTKDKVFTQSALCLVFTSCGESGTLHSIEESVCECVRWGTSSSSSSLSRTGVSYFSDVPGGRTAAEKHHDYLPAGSLIDIKWNTYVYS